MIYYDDSRLITYILSLNILLYTFVLYKFSDLLCKNGLLAHEVVIGEKSCFYLVSESKCGFCKAAKDTVYGLLSC